MNKLARTILIVVACAVGASAVRADDNLQLVEQKIKAGLIYNFLKYTSWPQEAAPAGPLVVCIFGGDPFDGSLQPMAGRTVNQRAIEVRAADAHAALSCSLLVVNEAKKSEWPTLKAALAGKPVLTVSDFNGFNNEGGMIEFTRVDNRIGIKLNTEALAASHLEIQDRLLKLASAVPASP